MSGEGGKKNLKFHKRKTFCGSKKFPENIPEKSQRAMRLIKI